MVSNNAEISTSNTAQVMLDAITFPVVGITSDLTISHHNQAAIESLTKNPQEKLLGQNCYTRLYSRQSPCPFCPMNSEWNSPTAVQEKIVHNSLDKKERIYRLTFRRIETEGSLSLVEVIEDITQEHEKQEEILRFEKLAAMGTMISGIAHELNNPLTGMELNLQNLSTNLNNLSSEEITSRLDIIRRDINRAGKIVNDILDFSVTKKLRLTRANLYQVARRAVSNIQRLYPVLSRKIEWRIQKVEDANLRIDSDKIERLFINLFRNSIQALDYDPGYIEVNFKKSNRFILISVKDNAGGIPPENLREIFNPFFSKSIDSRGSGLGLSICYSIIKEHGGRVRVRSSQGKTGFFISLPINMDNNE